jgi:MYXO-CTERM domain-containing protein
MRTLLIGLVAATSLLVPAIAHADQCAWMTQEQAIEGAKQIAVNGFGTNLLSYCEPCGDTQATAKPVKGISYNVVPDDPSYYQVKVNGNRLDLAYTYVLVDTDDDGKADTYVNAGSLAGCPVQDVTLQFAPGDVKVAATGKSDEASGDGEEAPEGGGCSTTGNSGASLFGFGALGLAFALGRRRRRA